MFPKNQAVFITALGTPVDENGDLIESSFRKHIRHQLAHGIDGFLVAGSMGMMPCLKFSTYVRSVEVAAEEAAGRAKLMVGVGDNSIEQTMERIRAVGGFKIDAVVATTPYYFISTQDHLIHYFTKVADLSPLPLYLYDLPQLTKVKTELPTMLRLADHPNIHGAKCSHEPAFVRTLFDAAADKRFEVISAQYDLIDMFLAHGILLQLDGFFCVMPGWLERIQQAHARKDLAEITRIQKRMTALRNEFIALTVFPAFTVAMNLLGFEGRFHPSHMTCIPDDRKPRIQQLLTDAGLL